MKFKRILTIEEKLVKHCAIGLFACMVDEGAVRKIQLVLIFGNTIQKRIKDFAANYFEVSREQFTIYVTRL